MKYLKKDAAHSEIALAGWSYPQHAADIRTALLVEQKGYCAYTEKYIQKIDAVDVEHFDPRLKQTPGDGYPNWYAVITWMNRHKPKRIEPYLPLLFPDGPDLARRIRFEHGLFVYDPNDIEAKNLVDFLGWNRPELVEARENHVDRVRDTLGLIGDDREKHRNYLAAHPEELSYMTALESALDLTLEQLLFDGAFSLGNRGTDKQGSAQ